MLEERPKIDCTIHFQLKYMDMLISLGLFIPIKKGKYKILTIPLDFGWTVVKSHIALSSPGVNETDKLNWDFLNFNLVTSSKKSIDSLLAVQSTKM